ncbi:hypothetical protein [Kutzneria buriramensis]|uniref:Uncharacterized protein n=1 Tax=Kutzneria buriramensis TaxID=1045776 RepID=A0A3E0IB89_9PSEU|nr:hypothetical protein [Kutzneria buriramensis]REH55861.1 hypothetical protein BCF44_101887 [Kutzneria buriramensis]
MSEYRFNSDGRPDLDTVCLYARSVVSKIRGAQHYSSAASAIATAELDAAAAAFAQARAHARACTEAYEDTVRSLELIEVRARELAQVETRTRAKAQAHEIHVRELYRARAEGEVRARELAEARAEADARAKACAYAEDRAREVAIARSIEHSLIDAHNMSIALSQALAVVPVNPTYLARADLLTHELAKPDVGSLARAYDIAVNLFESLNALRATEVVAVPAPPVARSAVRLIETAVRVLPTADRSRYSEEFRAELAELAGRRKQVIYALRLVSHAYSLRRSLTDPAHRRRAASGG